MCAATEKTKNFLTAGQIQALAVLVLAIILPASTSPSAQELARTPVGGVIRQEIQKLLAYKDTERANTVLLSRNFSRYFAVYEAPPDGEATNRLVRSLGRITRRFAVGLFRGAALEADRVGSSGIELAHVEAAIERHLPSREAPYAELIFFPRAAPAHRVTVEHFDLEAFYDTGLALNMIGAVLSNELTPEEQTRPFAAAAVRRFAEGVSAHGLLVLRISGFRAGAELAPVLESRHLRTAARDVENRASEAPSSGKPSSEAPSSEISGAPGRLFADISHSSGINFRHTSSPWLSRFRRYAAPAPTYSGGGVTAGDLDGDRWPDLIICGGEGCAAFHNRGDGTFAPAGRDLTVAGEARMALLVDFDNDGRRDVFLTYARDSNRLFRGLGGGRFRDVTAESGLEREGDISGPAVAFDYDGDGLLDLYVGNFGNYLGGETPWKARNSRNAQPNRLYRNLGGLRFTDTSIGAGVGDVGWAQAISHVDADGDGDQDLYIANDFGHNELLVNNGDGTFSAAGSSTGSDDRQHGMNVAFADLNRDQLADIFITNIWFWNAVLGDPNEFNTLLISQRLISQGDGGTLKYRPGGMFVPRDHDTGWSWAALFFDYDHDGDDDLYMVNGLTDYNTFIQVRPHPTIPGYFYPYNNNGDTNVLYRNDGGETAVDVSSESGADFGDVNSRGLALLDFDLDGDLDLAVSTFHARPRLLRNDAPAAGHRWLTVELVGDPAAGSNRDAIGARLIARGENGLYVWRTVTGGEGYLGMNTLPVELGLGRASEVDLEIRWPSGGEVNYSKVGANQRIRIVEGKPGFEVGKTDAAGNEGGR